MFSCFSVFHCDVEFMSCVVLWCRRGFRHWFVGQRPFSTAAKRSRGLVALQSSGYPSIPASPLGPLAAGPVAVCPPGLGGPLGSKGALQRGSKRGSKGGFKGGFKLVLNGFFNCFNGVLKGF